MSFMVKVWKVLWGEKQRDQEGDHRGVTGGGGVGGVLKCFFELLRMRRFSLKGQ